MKPIFFSTESQSPAATMIMNCFFTIEQNMQVVSLSKYTDCLDDIAIIPFCVDEEFLQRHPTKERKYIGWKRRDADIRLRMDYESFVQSSKEERMLQCRDVIICSLETIQRKCQSKGLRFDADSLIRDIFPDMKQERCP